MKAILPYVNQNAEAASLYSQYKSKKSKEDKDFDAAVLKEAIARAGGQDNWDIIGKAMQEKLKANARAKLNKGAK